jgi:hypothetical protein
MFVNSNHAGEKLMWQMRKGFFIYLNMAPIVWHSKKQVTIETSLWSKQGMEALQGLWYKLCMMGVQVNRPSYIYGDNMSVIHNTQWPKLTLKKKSNSVCYHGWAMWVTCYGQISYRPCLYAWQPCRYLYKDYSQWNEMRSLSWSNIIWFECMIPTPDDPPWWFFTKGLGFSCQCLTKYQDT